MASLTTNTADTDSDAAPPRPLLEQLMQLGRMVAMASSYADQWDRDDATPMDPDQFNAALNTFVNKRYPITELTAMESQALFEEADISLSGHVSWQQLHDVVEGAYGKMPRFSKPADDDACGGSKNSNSDSDSDAAATKGSNSNSDSDGSAAANSDDSNSDSDSSDKSYVYESSDDGELECSKNVVLVSTIKYLYSSLLLHISTSHGLFFLLFCKHFFFLKRVIITTD